MVVFLLRSTILLLNSQLSAKCFCPLPQALPATFLILFLFSRAFLLQSRNAFTCRQGTPGTLPRVRCSAGSGYGESQGKLTVLGTGWTHAAQGVQASSLVCDWWPPSCHCRGVGFEQNQGVPRGLADKLPPRAAGKVLQGGGNQEGPFSPWKKVIF